MGEQKPTDAWGSITYEFGAAWSRFWGLSWWWKGPSLGGAAFIALIIGVALAGGGGDDDTAELEATPTLTAVATPSPATMTRWCHWLR